MVPAALQTAFFTLGGVGLACVLVGLGWTRLCWRADMPPFGLDTGLADVLLHPEIYAEGVPAMLLRRLNLAGVVLLGAALAVVLGEIWRLARY